LGSEGAETGAAVAAGWTLSALGTAEAAGAGEAVGSFAVFGMMGRFPQPEVIKRTITATIVNRDR
jgi:hypothetical protein